MPSTLTAHTWPPQTGLSTTQFHTVFGPAPNSATDKSTLITCLRVVNTATDDLSVEYDLKVNGQYLMRGAHVLPRGMEDLAPGGTTLVLNKGSSVEIKVATTDGIAVHLDVITRS